MPMKPRNSTQNKSNNTATDIHDPAETNRINQASISETLYKQPERKPAPCTDKIFGSLPEEDADTSTSDTRDERSQDKHPSQCLVWGIDSSQHTEFENQNDADKG